MLENQIFWLFLELVADDDVMLFERPAILKITGHLMVHVHDDEMGWTKVALERKGRGLVRVYLIDFRCEHCWSPISWVLTHARHFQGFASLSQENNSSFRPTASNPRREILPHSVRYAHSNRQNPTHSSLRSECYWKWFFFILTIGTTRRSRGVEWGMFP